MKRHLLLSFLFLSVAAFGQNPEDVLRYSYLNPSGTARFLGAGGSFGALGADFSTLSQNPAGLALFRTDELMFSPSIRFTNTDATLAGSNPTLNETKSNFHFGNLGIVFNTNPGKSRWKTFNVGLGYNQLNNFNRGVYYSGTASGTVLNDWFAEAQSTLATGTEDDLDPFHSRMAYDANAIYYQDGALSYDFLGNENVNIERSQLAVLSGAMNEMVLSFAGNYDEKLMVGTTIGVPFVKYRQNTSYDETDPDNLVNYFDELNYNEYLQTDGIGVNLKLGVIYKVSQAFRLGASFHTPTWLSLTDKFDNSFSYTYTDNNGRSTTDASSPQGTFDYKLATPWRAAVSAAMLIKKYGFLSADVEWVDYSANSFNLTSDIASNDNQNFERQLNTAIQKDYGSAVNIRVGGEAVLDNFRLRAGVNLLGKPDADESGFNMGYSLGAGVRGESFYLDLGYRLSSGEGVIAAYRDGPEAKTKSIAHNLLMTVGFKF
ncbi:MAG: outer membrane protein transport protein [Saprospiraceae bacterium]|nr:outer membrane protein transport protein [Saprospiraceae bacterium]